MTSGVGVEHWRTARRCSGKRVQRREESRVEGGMREECLVFHAWSRASSNIVLMRSRLLAWWHGLMAYWPIGGILNDEAHHRSRERILLTTYKDTLTLMSDEDYKRRHSTNQGILQGPTWPRVREVEGKMSTKSFGEEWHARGFWRTQGE